MYFLVVEVPTHIQVYCESYTTGVTEYSNMYKGLAADIKVNEHSNTVD